VSTCYTTGMSLLQHDVTTADGRTLRVYDTADRDGHPVFGLHGTPGCGRLRQSAIDSARDQGLRLLSHDRPGYGGSSRQPGRRIGDVAADVAAIADQLDIDRFGVWGASGGGPHALACAALLPERVIAAVAIASPAPIDAEGLDYFADMGEMNAEEVEILAKGPERHLAWLREQADAMQTGSAEDLRAALSTLLAPVDREALTDELAAYLHENFRMAMAQGVEGWHDESVAELAPWGFDVGTIRVPVQIWHGRQDRFVPASHGRWLADHVPGADLQISDDDGHVSLIERVVPLAQGWLASQFG
jgi:pimeloyl-ACP methyl ester carboxylesterase